MQNWHYFDYILSRILHRAMQIGDRGRILRNSLWAQQGNEKKKVKDK